MVDADRTQDAPTPAHAPHPRSCVVCRQRKVKCDRQQPCSNCVRSACACVYPTGRGRAPKRARRVADAQLVEKLARLETIVQRLAAENGPGLVTDTRPPPLPQLTNASEQSRSTSECGLTPESSTQHEASGLAKSTSGRSSPVSSSIEASMSRLVIDDTKSYYVSNPLWATMAQEIEELRDFLGKSEDEDEDDKASSDVPSHHSNTNAALFGYRAIAHSLHPYHPPLSQAVNLFAAFSENVLPLLRIFHMPTLSTMYWEAVAAPTSLDKNIEALIFAVYYSATVSLPPEQCLGLLGLPHEAAIERYRFATEQAIARADLLTTQSVVLLQAATLFINALRSHDGSRVSWSLTTLVFQLAQTMGLHRDGTAFGLKPFETEMRRRLWWHICILDSRSSDHHGFGPMLYHSLYDTHIPLNVNDEDLSPNMTEPPPEREEATDMCFCLIRCEAMKAATKIKLLSPDVPSSSNRSLGLSSVPLEERIKVIRELEARLQDRYIRYCNPSSTIQLMTTLLSRLIIVHFWLMTCYLLMRQDDSSSSTVSGPSQTQPAKQSSTTHSSPSPHPGAVPGSPSSSIPPIMTRDQLFASSIEVLELSARIIHIDAAHKWSWYSKIHIQWHIVAFVLSEICRRPPSPACERAWATVTTMYAVWNMQSGATPGLMWKSVRRLMAKTKYVREMQALRGDRRAAGLESHALPHLPGGPPEHSVLDNFSAPAPDNPQPSMWGPLLTAPAGVAVEPAAQRDFQQGILGMADDQLIDMMDLPADLPMDDLFGSLDASDSGFTGGMGDGQLGLDGLGWSRW